MRYHQVRASGVHQMHNLKVGTSAVSEVAQQISQILPSLAASHWVLTHLCSRVGSHRVIQVFGPNRPKFIHVKGGLYIVQAFKGKFYPILESHNSVCLRFFQEPDLIKVGLSRVGREGGTDWSGLGRVGSSPCPKATQLSPEFCLDLGRAEPPGVRRVKPLGAWGVGLEYLL